MPNRAATQSGLDALLRRHNFRAGEAAVLEAHDERNVDDDDSNDGDSCFTFSVVKNR